jgi:hypothetical protein
MASSDIKHKLETGLPDLPFGLPDKEFAMLSPLYRALQSLAVATSKASGLTTYSPAYYEKLKLRDTATVARMNYIPVRAGESILFGEPVNLYQVSGELLARRAMAADNTKICVALCGEEGGITSGAFGKCYLGGCYLPIPTSDFGPMYLAPTGGYAINRPTTAGQIVQAVGFALGSHGLFFSPDFLFTQL